MSKWFLIILLPMVSCAFTPAYKMQKVDYCERVNGVIECDDYRINTNYYPECSIYDEAGCR